MVSGLLTASVAVKLCNGMWCLAFLSFFLIALMKDQVWSQKNDSFVALDKFSYCQPKHCLMSDLSPLICLYLLEFYRDRPINDWSPEVDQSLHSCCSSWPGHRPCKWSTLRVTDAVRGSAYIRFFLHLWGAIMFCTYYIFTSIYHTDLKWQHKNAKTVQYI